MKAAVFNRAKAIEGTGVGPNIYISDEKGNKIYVLDRFTGTVMILFTMSSNTTVKGNDVVSQVTLLAGTGEAGYKDGIGSSAKFKSPSGLAVQSLRTGLCVSDRGNHAIRIITRESPDKPAVVDTVAGSDDSGAGFADGEGPNALFNHPEGLAMSPDGSFILVADSGNHRIRKVLLSKEDKNLVSTIAGGNQNRNVTYSQGFNDADNGVNSSFNRPTDVAFLPNGEEVLVVDAGNHAIRKLTLSTGAVTTIAGNGNSGSDNGFGTNATFEFPMSIVISAGGKYAFIAEMEGQRIRQLHLSTGQVTTLAGTGDAGSSDGTFLKASFNMPCSLNVIDSRRLMVLDYENSAIRVIAVQEDNENSIQDYCAMPSSMDDNLELKMMLSSYNDEL
ncbi:hypothetical protein GUITHDRAFT_105483 [Guillardia theta CCMP2712]|uniref:SMP-30/Gluconolactonase/LRE-like region domain-containing protein n=1 Tax=Guillardia theta (strain CCMP2712) TaxID=905079 RepID=L1JL62_GUITC|nr:hypothetical protein GUITHDRAFT_105483 [Guillardia theta CCMP2712]EKX48859.1 hypothetical protein GUITHDRAFT_105483 [Guillardia theta CCMP2712]|eukprot:XP_005835839.1 hypothetical protein GUITHDRAFT_105483 [Guillardia theta CCMP2712]